MIASIVAHGEVVTIRFKSEEKNGTVEEIKTDQRVFENLITINCMINDLGGYKTEEILPLPHLVDIASLKDIIKLIETVLDIHDNNPDFKDITLKEIAGKLVSIIWKGLKTERLFKIMKTVHYLNVSIIEEELSKILIESLKHCDNKIFSAILAELLELPLKNIVNIAVESRYYREYLFDESFFALDYDLKSAFIRHVGLDKFSPIMRDDIYHATQKDQLEILYKIGLEVFFPNSKKRPEGYEEYSARAMFYVLNRNEGQFNNQSKMIILGEGGELHQNKSSEKVENQYPAQSSAPKQKNRRPCSIQ